METSTFTGTVSDDAIVGAMAWAGGKSRFHLRLARVRNFAAKTPQCK